MVLQWCYSGVTVLLQWRYTGVTVVLHLLTPDHGGKSAPSLQSQLLGQHNRYL
jgi:hypothetical protein